VVLSASAEENLAKKFSHNFKHNRKPQGY